MPQQIYRLAKGLDRLGSVGGVVGGGDWRAGPALDIDAVQQDAEADLHRQRGVTRRFDGLVVVCAGLNAFAAGGYVLRV